MKPLEPVITIFTRLLSPRAFGPVHLRPHATIGVVTEIVLLQGDITLQAVDAIVNAANSQLAGGGGVDGAVHRRGGPTIMQETAKRYPEGCPTGSAVISGAGNLAAKHVIHAVGPFWSGGERREADLLASAIRHSLELAIEHDCKSIALPALSTGAYRYPLAQAAEVSVAAAVGLLKERGQPELVRFVLFDDQAFAAFSAALESFSQSSADARQP